MDRLSSSRPHHLEKDLHYNRLLVDAWHAMGHEVVYQPSILQAPYGPPWGLRLPPVPANDRTVVLLHLQDYVTIQNGRCMELQMIEQHYGASASRVVVVHWNYDLRPVYSGPLHLIYFPTLVFEVLCNLRSPNFREWRSRPLSVQRQWSWQCLNGLEKPHRVYAHRWLKPLSTGITCLGRTDPLIKDAYHDSYRLQTDPWAIENNLPRLSWVYEHSWINIVTETLYNGDNGIISEKTLFAWLSGQLPILIGYRGIVDHCRQLGFDMFDDVIDHAYDGHDDPVRWQQALELNQSLLQSPQDFSDLMPRLQTQRDWCLDSWPDVMLAKYQNRCAEISQGLC
jgi:hypothetical protein